MDSVALRNAILLAAWALSPGYAAAQPQAECGPGTYRVIASRWDVLLRIHWQLRQDCSHPEWPSRTVADRSPAVSAVASLQLATVPAASPQAVQLVVQAGDAVHLWRQEENVRIEMVGVAEQGAHIGEHIAVRIPQARDDGGTITHGLGGTVRGPGNVEMDR
jgi:hypothetical protein